MLGLTLGWSWGDKSPFRNYPGDTARDIEIIKLANMLNDSLRQPALKNREIGILTFVNLDNLEKVEPLGRFLQERLSHSLFDLGYRIIEIRLGKDIRYEPLTGEINLTRLREFLVRGNFPEIKSFVLGAYQDAGDYVYVNAKLVELENSQLRASGEIQIKKGSYLSRLLNMEDDPDWSSKRDEVYERIPAKPRKEAESSKK